MTDLAVAIGLVLVIEGLVWALSPASGKKLLELAAAMPEASLRLAGWSAVVVGVIIVWMMRG